MLNSEGLTFDGENGGGTLTVTGAGQFVHTPGNAIDAGHMGLDNLLGRDLCQLDMRAGIANGTGGADTLVAMGTNASDVLAVTFTAGNAIDVDLSSALGTHVDLAEHSRRKLPDSRSGRR